MAITRISGNQIADTTEAVITTLSFLNTNSVFRLPTGTEAQRPSGVAGMLRYNTDINLHEQYVDGNWEKIDKKTTGKSIALAMVKPDLANVGEKLKVDILGKMYEATILEESPYDAENKLLRA